MNNNDNLQRFIIENKSVRGMTIRLNQSYADITAQHPYSSAQKRLLGEALAATGLLSAIIKFDGNLSIQFRSVEALKLLSAQCNHHLHLRGLIKSAPNLPYETLLQTISAGNLSITLQVNGKNTFQGIVPWLGGSLAHSVEGYFKHSEQLPTKLWLWADETKAMGLLLQALPNHRECEDMGGASMDSLSSFADFELAQFNVDQLTQTTTEDLLCRLFPDESIRLFSSETVQFKCTCSEERSFSALKLLSKAEIEEMIADDEMVKTTCDFCNKTYQIHPSRLSKFLQAEDDSAAS